MKSPEMPTEEVLVSFQTGGRDVGMSGCRDVRRSGCRDIGCSRLPDCPTARLPDCPTARLARLPQALESFPELVARPVDVGLYGSQRQVEGGGDLLVRSPLNVPQHDAGSILGPEA